MSSACVCARLVENSRGILPKPLELFIWLTVLYYNVSG